jgi:hypothetical protein
MKKIDAGAAFEKVAEKVFDAVKGENAKAVEASLGFHLTALIINTSDSHLEALERVGRVSEKLVETIDNFNWSKREKF